MGVDNAPQNQGAKPTAAAGGQEKQSPAPARGLRETDIVIGGKVRGRANGKQDQKEGGGGGGREGSASARENLELFLIVSRRTARRAIMRPTWKKVLRGW